MMEYWVKKFVSCFYIIPLFLYSFSFFIFFSILPGICFPSNEGSLVFSPGEDGILEPTRRLPLKIPFSLDDPYPL